ncbi:aspartate aminotransferase, cytoplasmic-like isoform X2 [Belonocnema kinseyi]|nr:aspartate aminotransferase, cytoplasmic-like isoform X2 [Belonocnema kinseyi]
MMKILVESSIANINAEDSEKWTPLHIAASCGHLDLVRYLIALGANLLAVNTDGNMPYDICIDQETLQYIGEEMVKIGVTQKVIDEARASTEKQMLLDLKKIASDGGNLEFKDHQGAAPIHIAAANGYSSVVKFLLHQKVSIDIEDNDKWQSVHAAACWGHFKVLEMLVQNGADLNAKNKNGQTPADLCEDPEFREQIIQLKMEQECKRLPKAQGRRIRKPQSITARMQCIQRTCIRDKILMSNREVQEAQLRIKAQQTKISSTRPTESNGGMIEGAGDSFQLMDVDKVSAHRTNDANPWVLPVVRKVEKRLAEDEFQNHEYLPVLDQDAFCEAATSMLLGDKSPAISEGRAFGIQTFCDGTALRVAADFLSHKLQYDTFYCSSPTLETHKVIFTSEGFKNVCNYRYWSPETRGLDLDGMLEDLRNAPENAVIILHACGHNPTGCDPNMVQWGKIADVIQEKRLYPLFYSAYQGLASGDFERDAAGVRLFAERGLEFICTQSFANNFGLYYEQVGNMVIVLNNTKEILNVKSQISMIIRGMYGSPPKHGARVVATILQDPYLFEEWKVDLLKMSNTLKKIRSGLYHKMMRLETPGDWEFIVNQKGIFAHLGLNETQVTDLYKKYGIKLLQSGTIHLCKLYTYYLDPVAEAIDKVVRKD